MLELVNGQNNSGKVSFITSQNVYVKFDNTERINIGDTLQIAGTKTPCLVVNNKSSSSCVCVLIGNCELKINDNVSYHSSALQKVKQIEKATTSQDENLSENLPENDQQKKDSLKYKEDISGRISVSNYSNISDIRDDRHRVMSRFSLDADHIHNSAFSFETYLNFRHNLVPGEAVKLDKKDFKVYNLALKYNVTPSLLVIVGRKINPKFSSLGAIDGLQVEKSFGGNYIGVISGFRPDIYDFTFNPNLFQYGAYMGRTTVSKNFYSQTTLGITEQQNKGLVDRRYAYFQHASTIMKKLNIFSSMELDVYNKVSDTLGSDFRLTNLYLSARYRFTRKFDVSLSYDNRKSIIYYETFQTEIERLLNDDIARQGVRIRANVRPIKYVITGLSYSRRFQSDNQNKSENIYGFMSLSKIPKIGGRLSVNYNINSSNYLESNALSIRHSRVLINKKLDADFYYRRVDYVYLNREKKFKQDYYGVNLSYNITRKLMFSLSGELSNYNQEKNYNIYVKVVNRFSKNTKK